MHATTSDNVIELPSSRVHPAFAGMNQRELAAELTARIHRLDMAQLATLTWLVEPISAADGSEVSARCGSAPSR